MNNSKTKKNLRNIFAVAACVPMLAALFTAVPAVQQANASTATDLVGEGNTYYEIESKDHKEAVSMLNQAQLEIAREGMVLLKNEDNILPMAEGSNVTVFGNGQNKTAVRTNSIIDSLTSAGFRVNPTVRNFYNSSLAPGRSYTPGNGHNVSGYQTYEAPVSSFNFDAESAHFADYDDAAFVVISRIGGEGADLPTRMAYNPGGQAWGGFDDWNSDTPSPGARSADDHYLQLDQYETDLLDYVCSNFDNVILLLNTYSPMELGFLDDPGHYAYHPEIKGALFMGAPAAGANALGEILTGKVNPSGHLVDTFSRDFTKDPTWQNFSKNLETNGDMYTYGSGTTSNFAFVYYEEGIYVGYRYWETRGYTEGTEAYNSTEEGLKGTTTTEWDSWYDAHVIYPLGYGLSYTTFDWELVSQSPEEGSSLAKDGTISATVKVTNTGSVAGKDVVQMYYTAPYYEGGIEKAHVVMSGFRKTDLLEPGESQNVTITMKVEDMKSYDYSDANGNDIRGYELEHGDYQVKLARNAHDIVETLNYKVDEDVYYDVDSATGNKVENLFDDVSFNEFGVKKYMSRSDFEGTFPTSGTLKKQVTSSFIDTLWDPGSITAAYDEGKPWYTDEPVEFAEEGEEAEIMLNYLVGRDYDDPLWDKFMAQLTREEAGMLPGHGYYETRAIERLNKPSTFDCDGPWGWGGTNSDGHGLSSLCGPMISQTYNPDMGFLRGAMMAETGYHANGSNSGRISGWYAPGMNIHRSPFSGRNNEYYSEDGYISGVFAAAETKGAASKGMYAYAKHMFLNDQETDRGTADGILTWSNEQAMREIYAKPFEIAVKEGNTHAVMSSFNRIGATKARYSWSTLTGLLRNEWGFEGMVVTDWMGDGQSAAQVDMMLRAGNDLLLGNREPSNSDAANTPTHERAIYNAAKNILFTVANCNAMNGVGFDWGNPVKDIPLEYADQRITVTKDAASSATVATAVAPGKTDGITYELVGGNLPAGLTLNADGTLTGTPTGESGLYEVQVKATDTTTRYAYKFAPATSTVSIILQAEGESLAVQYTGGTLQTGICGSEFTASVATATVNSTAEVRMVYTLKDGSTLPEGLTMNSSGQIAGRPVQPVQGYKFTVIASVAGNDTWIPTEAEFTLDITGRMFLNQRTINIYKQLDFERQLDLFAADGDPGSVTFAVKDGTSLPEGVTLDAATGKLSGKIAEPGTYTFTVTAAADGYTQTEAVITIVVHEYSYVN